jgi:hypothetical protein
MYLRIGSASVSFLLTALLFAASQQIPVSTQQPKIGQVMPERDKEKEDWVARLFEHIRAEANLPHLKRIRHRPQLEQDICTSALNGDHSKRGSAFYVTTDPESPAPELTKIASSNPQDRYHSGKPIYERYSVAVWRTKDPQTGNASYWVGVGVYGNAVGEFVDCHFTDDVSLLR